ncbi:Ger(x)C family spore germination protein [Paraliobacillus ryukyuensis]|uniref:Ger(x)C family spore germination protein n=1 Tax=Paraliobacillus ryukyuensis TaxID=200904 RepID=UPI0009A57CFE|nr:Ger(x)C family spore germination protein [Paraliobacillus ryukyuensis]
MGKYINMLYAICLCVWLSGCWSANELSSITIATALGIDKSEKGFTLTLQVLNPNEIAGKEGLSSRTAISNYTESGATFFEAVRKLTKVTPRKVFLSHLMLVAYGESVAEEGISSSLDFLIRDHELRTDFVMAIVKDNTAGELISVLTPLEKISASKIYDSIESAQDYWAPTKKVQVDELVNSLTAEGKEAVLTGIYIVGNSEEGQKLQSVEQTKPLANIYINGIGVFNGDQLVGWLNEEESKGFNYITNNVKKTVGWVSIGNGKVSVEVKKNDTKIIMNQKNDAKTFDVVLKTVVNIGEVETDFMIMDQSDVQKIEEKVAEKIEKICQASITKAKEYESDIFGFGEVMRKTSPEEWGKVKDNWSKQFVFAEINVKAEVQIDKSGMITSPFYKKIKEKNSEE